MFTCPAEGSYSLLGLVPGAAVMDGQDDGPVLVHLTACRQHLKANRSWLRSRMLPQDDVMTLSTDYLMNAWGQIVEPMEIPVFAPASVA
jgi:hypothetical protein